MDITFNTGLMGAGKSKKLIDDYLMETKEKVALSVSLTEDTFSRGKIESRDGRSLKSINLNKDQFEQNISLLEAIIFMTNTQTIFIDESQFLPKETIEKFVSLSQVCHVPIHFYGLDLTFTGELFDSSNYLLTILPSKNIIRVSRKCEAPQCFKEAEYNARIVDGKVSRSGETFVKEKSNYLALCSDHYYNNEKII
ncbi:thymidine kinase [Alkalihalobacillus gibsonii]|uniref:thymidine kinase n=1 Tax=Bacillus subtilis TaxID=1423 RepID=UPI001DABBB86|nr:thymidine kinase [Alkalicoccobacillus gibsonii]